MEECIKMERSVVLDSLNGLMEVRTKVNLRIMKSRSTESTDGITGIHMLVTGRILDGMVKDFLPGVIADRMRESTSTAKNRAGEFLHGQMRKSGKDFGITEIAMG